jgi:hypothetical protein
MQPSYKLCRKLPKQTHTWVDMTNHHIPLSPTTNSTTTKTSSQGMRERHTNGHFHITTTALRDICHNILANTLLPFATSHIASFPAQLSLLPPAPHYKISFASRTNTSLHLHLQCWKPSPVVGDNHTCRMRQGLA